MLQENFCELNEMIVNSNFLSSRKIERSGIIPYTSVNGEMFFLLAVDNYTGELGDFGGGSKYNESALDTAKREFEEESKGIFKAEYPNIDCFTNKISVIDKNMAITFVYINPSWKTDAIKRFNVNKGPNDEIIDIVWVDKSTFEKLVHRRNVPNGCKTLKMWKKVRDFFKKIKGDSNIWHSKSEYPAECPTERPTQKNYIYSQHAL
jgi:hypothetical protein